MKQLELFSTSDQLEIQSKRWYLFTDGASRNNPGISGAGIAIQCDDQIVSKEGFFIGIKTNNQAEYIALLLGIYFLSNYTTAQDNIFILSDSKLLVNQMLDVYKIKHPELKPLNTLAKTMIKKYNVKFMHIYREDNTLADQMANEGIDLRKPVPADFLTFVHSYGISI